MRVILDGKIETEPRTWEISKVNRMSPNGITRLTLYQTAFDEHTDYIEKDENGNIIGMWADYFSSAIEPSEDTPLPPEIHVEITYSGTKPELKSGGSYKKFSVNFYDENESLISYEAGTWSFEIDGVDATPLINILDNTTSSDVAENQIKVKFTGGDKYIGKVMNVKYESISGITNTIPIEIKGL